MTKIRQVREQWDTYAKEQVTVVKEQLLQDYWAENPRAKMLAQNAYNAMNLVNREGIKTIDDVAEMYAHEHTGGIDAVLSPWEIQALTQALEIKNGPTAAAPGAAPAGDLLDPITNGAAAPGAGATAGGGAGGGNVNLPGVVAGSVPRNSAASPIGVQHKAKRPGAGIPQPTNSLNALVTTP